MNFLWWEHKFREVFALHLQETECQPFLQLTSFSAARLHSKQIHIVQNLLFKIETMRILFLHLPETYTKMLTSKNIYVFSQISPNEIQSLKFSLSQQSFTSLTVFHSKYVTFICLLWIYDGQIEFELIKQLIGEKLINTIFIYFKSPCFYG